MDSQRNTISEPSVTYRQVTEIQSDPEPGTSRTDRDSTGQPSVTYRQVAEIHQDAVFESTSANSVQYDYIDHVAVGDENADRRPDGNQASIQYDDTAAQNQYDYIDDTFHTQRNNSKTKLPDILRKYKITIIVIVSVLLIIGIAGIAVVALFLPAKSNTNDDSAGGHSDNESPKSTTTSRPPCEQSISHIGTIPTGAALLVIIGGRTYNETFDFVYHDNVQIYAVDKGHVTYKKEGKAATYPWYNAGTAVLGNNIYIAGGKIIDNGEEDIKAKQSARYNVKDDSWGSLPNKTDTARFGPAMYIIDNRIYAADGDGSWDHRWEMMNRHISSNEHDAKELS